MITGSALGTNGTVQGASATTTAVANHIADWAKGALRMVIDSRFPLAEAAEPQGLIESRLAFGRVLLIP